jgi:exodeoxyribonuclease VII large subunit
MLSTRLNKLDLRRFIDHRREILARYRQALVAGIRVRLHQERSRLQIAVGKIDVLSPLSILQRGFALCRDEQGHIVKNAAEVSRGDKVRVTLAMGELDCLVENSNK